MAVNQIDELKRENLCLHQAIESFLETRYKITLERDAALRRINQLENILCEIHSILELRKTIEQLEQLKVASNRLGAWMSSALEDDCVCEAMKIDIRNWFDALEKL